MRGKTTTLSLTVESLLLKKEHEGILLALDHLIATMELGGCSLCVGDIAAIHDDLKSRLESWMERESEVRRKFEELPPCH